MESPAASGKAKKDKSSTKKKEKGKKSGKKSGKKEKRERDEAEAVTPVTSKSESKVDVKDAEGSTKKVRVERTPHAPRYFPLNPISNPLASDDLAKELFGLIALAVKANAVRRGVKEATKFLRKGEKGIMVFAGDVEPLDVMSHMPILCEDSEVPYVFVKSREELGLNAGLKRPTACILIKDHASYAAQFAKLKPLIPVALPTY